MSWSGRTRCRKARACWPNCSTPCSARAKRAKPRAQKIDGSQLPEYQVVRRYLGPAGLQVTSEPDGWFFKGFTLNKRAEQPERRPLLSSDPQDLRRLHGPRPFCAQTGASPREWNHLVCRGKRSNHSPRIARWADDAFDWAIPLRSIPWAG